MLTSPPNSNRRAAIAAIGAVFVAGWFAVHLPWLRAGLWRDEAVSVYVGSAPDPGSYFQRYATMDYSPPLFDGIVGIWGHAFGWSPPSLAALDAMCGLFAIAAVAWAAGEIAGPWAALFAALFAASSDILFWEVDQVRPYAFSAGAAALVVALLARRWAGRNEPEAPVRADVFGAACILLALSHYAGTLAVAVLGVASIAGVARRENRAFWSKTLIACAISGVVLVPWLPTMLRQMSVGLPWNEHRSWPGRVANAAALASDLAPKWGPHASAWSVVPFALTAIAGIAAAREVSRELAGMGATLAIALSWAIAVMVVTGAAFGISRYLSIAAATTAVALSCVLVAIGRAWRARSAGAAMIFAAGALLAAGPVTGEAYRFLGSHVRERRPSRSGVPSLLAGLPARRSDLFLAAPSYLAPTLWYYGIRGDQLHGFPQWNRPEAVDYSRLGEAAGDPAAARDCVERVSGLLARSGFERVILLTDRNPDPKLRQLIREIADGLSAVADRIAQGTFHGYPETIDVTVFARRR